MVVAGGELNHSVVLIQSSSLAFGLYMLYLVDEPNAQHFTANSIQAYYGVSMVLPRAVV